MFEKFTERARKVMSLARQEAQRLHSEYIGPEHILLAMLREGSGVGARTLNQLNVDLKRVRQELELFIKPGPSSDVTLVQLPFSPPCKRIIELAGEAASQMGLDVLGTEHLLIGLIREGESIAALALSNLGLKPDEIQSAVLEALGHKTPAPAPKEEGPLQRLSRSFLALADRPALQESIVALLQQGKSIALIGPPHVGKTSLAMALCRSKAGGFAYESLDYRCFDPLQPRVRPEPGRVLLVAEAELLAASRSEAVKPLARAHLEKERLILEFRDGAFEAFAARYPNFAKSLTTVTVAAPDAAERTLILESERRRLIQVTGTELPDALLAEADRLARGQWPKLVAPWPTLLALWKAVEIHRETEGKGDLMQLEKDIEELEKSTDPKSIAQAEIYRMHLTGLRGIGRTQLSIEDVRRAIGELSGQSAGEST